MQLLKLWNQRLMAYLAQRHGKPIKFPTPQRHKAQPPYPSSQVVIERLVEATKLGGYLLEPNSPLVGRILHVTLRDGTTGYLVEIYEPLHPPRAEGLVGRSYLGINLYASADEARLALPEEVAQKPWRFIRAKE